MNKLKVGDKAPKFNLMDKEGKEHGVGLDKSDYLVLFFYPKDNTPGCTLEAQGFSAALKDFSRRKAKVIGISGGDRKTKDKFCVKYDLMVALVSDTEFSVAKAYGVFGDKKFMGRVYKGIFRTTFIVDKSGKIAHIFDDVKPDGHAEEVLGVLKGL
jgi:peroxiredoxin Q/BCP